MTRNRISSSPDWMPVWAMPNVTFEEPVETHHAALVPFHDKRLRKIARRNSTLRNFIRSFRDEFRSPILPTVALLRDGAPEGVRTVPAFGSLRDAVCVSAVVVGRSMTLKWKQPRGIPYSDAFEVYPWFPSPQYDGHIIAGTPAIAAMHTAASLRPQSTPALAERSLKSTDLDDALLRVLLARWEDCFANGTESIENRRLFRSLDMARSASKMPGGADANLYDAGRAAALWVSACEILAHNGHHADFRSVLSVLGRVQWLDPKLQMQDREVTYKGKSVQTNLAGAIYERLYRARNAFLHGNPVTAETLRLKRTGDLLWFAAPVFRLVLTAALHLTLEALPDTAAKQDHARHIARRISFRAPQHLAEEAILVADAPPPNPAQTKQNSTSPRAPSPIASVKPQPR